MFQAPQLQQVNVQDLASKFKSKKEVYRFLVQDCQSFLPPIKSTNIYFLKEVVRGGKEYIKRDQVLVSAVPQIEGLTVEDILEIFKGDANLMKYIPDERDWVHTYRKWICDVLYTLNRDNFQAIINGALRKRRDKLDTSRDQLVSMRPEFAQALSSCMNFSVGGGRSAALLKGSSKRKRTRDELEEVKGEERELKADRQSFLKSIKRLKDNNASLVKQVTTLNEASMDQERVDDQADAF